MIDAILDHISRVYSPREYPALAEQLATWRHSRPFAGKKVIDATPVFTNTLVKYLPLLAGGAELSVGVGELTPTDPELLPRLREWGIPVVAPEDCRDDVFDVIMDCAGVFARVKARCGYVELTRSGLYEYRDVKAPVFFADAGKIKLIETTLGTGEGYCRALEQLGYGLSGKSLLVFGGGKVGRGIALYGRHAGATVKIVEFASFGAALPEGVRHVPAEDTSAVAAAIAAADLIVSATGRAGALSEHAAALRASSSVIANMGVLDEFGPELPPERVLNAKRPLNFILKEPTQLKFIDPTMALDNAGALEVLNGRVGVGVGAPPPELEEKILTAVRRDGDIKEELNWLGE